jgi:hypothetical protein
VSAVCSGLFVAAGLANDQSLYLLLDGNEGPGFIFPMHIVYLMRENGAGRASR